MWVVPRLYGPHLSSCYPRTGFRGPGVEEVCTCSYVIESGERELAHRAQREADGTQEASRKRWLDSGGRERLMTIQRLVDTRHAARGTRQYDKADACAKQLREMEVDLYDQPDGSTHWRYGLIITGRTH